ncbi:MAG TPA: YggS family pyridoxal phosphate-dependent enzyme [Armatimonadota bacterium]|nr:YggS family pyridoxal phosphate-dependent enzyme [Armatimonadota bacterium]
MAEIADRVQEVMDRIAHAAQRSGRAPDAIRLVAATKAVSPDRIREAAGAGVRAIGENYVQEAMAKRQSLADLALEWHLIGHLQTNKAKQARATFDLFETVDRLEIGRALARRGGPGAGPAQALIQVFLGGGEQRSGVHPEALPELLDALAAVQELELRGLMGVPPVVENSSIAETRRYFARLRELFEAGRKGRESARWDTLSMGMSADYEAAIEAGATSVRVGTAIFGPRPV